MQINMASDSTAEVNVNLTRPTESAATIYTTHPNLRLSERAPQCMASR